MTAYLPSRRDPGPAYWAWAAATACAAAAPFPFFWAPPLWVELLLAPPSWPALPCASGRCSAPWQPAIRAGPEHGQAGIRSRKAA